LGKIMGKGVVIGKNVKIGAGTVIWNYVVILDNTQIGERCRIGSFTEIGSDVTIGDDTIIQAHCTISHMCKIGSRVFIGPNSSLLNDKFPHSRHIMPLTPCIIEDDVTIGGGVIILPNVTVHSNSIVAAGSIVTKDVPSGYVVKGIPARIYMTIDEYMEKRREFARKH